MTINSLAVSNNIFYFLIATVFMYAHIAYVLFERNNLPTLKNEITFCCQWLFLKVLLYW